MAKYTVKQIKIKQIQAEIRKINTTRLKISIEIKLLISREAAFIRLANTYAIQSEVEEIQSEVEETIESMLDLLELAEFL